MHSPPLIRLRVLLAHYRRDDCDTEHQRWFYIRRECLLVHLASCIPHTLTLRLGLERRLPALLHLPIDLFYLVSRPRHRDPTVSYQDVGV